MGPFAVVVSCASGCPCNQRKRGLDRKVTAADALRMMELNFDFLLANISMN